MESAKAYENKAIECVAVAETIENPKQKAAMLQVASWWRRLAKFRRGAVKPPSDSQPAP
jgi:putative IMPACT (imprinted ancient) family translation regulator